MEIHAVRRKRETKQAMLAKKKKKKKKKKKRKILIDGEEERERKRVTGSGAGKRLLQLGGRPGAQEGARRGREGLLEATFFSSSCFLCKSRARKRISSFNREREREGSGSRKCTLSS